MKISAPESPLGSMGRRSRLALSLLFLAGLVAAMLTGCGATTAGTSVTGKTLKTITVSPATVSLAEGATQQFTATATYTDSSTANITSNASWATANSAIATVNSSGMVTAVAAGSTTITASQSGFSGTAAITVSATAKAISSIAVTPASASISAGATQQFTATATYSDGSTANVSSQAAWSSSDDAVATVNSTGLATGVAAGSATITASLNGTSGTATLTVTASTGGGGGGNVNITTWHVDNNRSGLNSNETILTPGNVDSSSFGKLFSYTFDGYAYGEPLIVSNLTIHGAQHDVLFVATEADMVYAFDADNGSSTPLWSASLLRSGETPLTNAAIQPYEGVTSTPVIDLSNNTIYVVSEQMTSSGGTFRLNALDLATGAQKFGGPVTITGSVSGSVANNDTLTTSCIQRSALLLANGNIYFGVGDCPAGWLLAYNATTLAQVAVWNASPNIAGEGQYASAGGVWMGSGGPVADSSGNVYIVTGNGPWDGQTAWGDSVIRFNSTLQIEDYFTPDAYAFMNCYDADFAAGGLMMIPGTSDLVAGGKIGKVFLLNSGSLGHEQANDIGALDSVWFESDLSAPYSQSCSDSSGTHTAEISSYEIFGTSAYFDGYVYLGISPTSSSAVAPVRQFQFSGNTLTPGAYTGPAAQDQQENTRGTTPFISSNGSQDGIVWMINEGVPLQQGTPTAAVLYAYDAQNFPNPLYASNTNSADAAGYGIKFTSPVVANGKVYISTGHDPTTASNPLGEIDVYGLK